jgi:hypothetical protein
MSETSIVTDDHQEGEIKPKKVQSESLKRVKPKLEYVDCYATGYGQDPSSQRNYSGPPFGTQTGGRNLRNKSSWQLSVLSDSTVEVERFG